MSEPDKNKVIKLLDTLSEAIEYVITNDNPTWIELYTALKFCEEFHNTDPVLQRISVTDEQKTQAEALAKELVSKCKSSVTDLLKTNQEDKNSQAIDEDKYRN